MHSAHYYRFLQRNTHVARRACGNRKQQLDVQLLIRLLSTDNNLLNGDAHNNAIDKKEAHDSNSIYGIKLNGLHIPDLNEISEDNKFSDVNESIFPWEAESNLLIPSTSKFEDYDKKTDHLEFTFQRLIKGSNDADTHGNLFNREESKKQAITKAEQILATLRLSMTEVQIVTVIHRLALYITQARSSKTSRNRLIRSLADCFGSKLEKERNLFIAFLEGNNEAFENSNIEVSLSDSNTTSINVTNTEKNAQEERTTSKVIGLNGAIARNPILVSIVFYYCHLACLGALKLHRNPSVTSLTGRENYDSLALWRIKHDFRKVLDMEGYEKFGDLLGIVHSTANSKNQSDIDQEYEEYTLENDRLNYRIFAAKIQPLVLKLVNHSHFTDGDIANIIAAIMASLNTSRLHRDVFREVVCALQAAIPDEMHENFLSELVPLLSGNNATYDDFQSTGASDATRHYRLRHEAMLRVLLETRMRVGHILVYGIDELDYNPLSILSSTSIPPQMHEKVTTVAWNIVSLLHERRYHSFFHRFLKHKLTWRPHQKNYEGNFLSDIEKIFAEYTNLLMPMFKEAYPYLSIETLTICKVKVKYARNNLYEFAVVKQLPEKDGQSAQLENNWDLNRSVFYTNVPFGCIGAYIRNSLRHIGEITRCEFYTLPVKEIPLEETKVDDDYEILNEEDGDESESIESNTEDGDALLKRKKLRYSRISLKMNKNVIASQKKSPCVAIVEFASAEAKARAMTPSFRIFGIMTPGFLENRPIFATSPSERLSISFQNIPYGTTVGEIRTQVNRIMNEKGLSIEVDSSVPAGIAITNGRLDWNFNTFTDAALVVDVVGNYVNQMKDRKTLNEEEKKLVHARETWNKSQLKKKIDKKSNVSSNNSELNLIKENILAADDDIGMNYFLLEKVENNLGNDTDPNISEKFRPFNVSWSDKVYTHRKKIFDM